MKIPVDKATQKKELTYLGLYMGCELYMKEENKDLKVHDSFRKHLDFSYDLYCEQQNTFEDIKRERDYYKEKYLKRGFLARILGK